MTELARIIGQSDPFAADPARAERSAQQPGDWRDPRSGYDDYVPPPDPRDAGFPAAQHGAPPPRQGGEAYPHAGAYGDFSYDEPRHSDPHHHQTGYVDPRDAEPRYGAAAGDPRYDDGRYDDPSAVRSPAHGDARHDHCDSREDYPEDRPFPADSRGYDETGLHDARVGPLERPFGDTPCGDSYDRFHGRDHEHEEYDERPAPRRRGLVTVVALFVLLVVGAAGAFGYRLMFGGSGSGPAPVIRADGGPNKVVPQNQSSDAAANKQIYDRLADRNQNERIVPREEQPLDIRDTTRQTAPRAILAPTTTASTTTASVPPVGQANAPTAFATASGPAGQEPRKVRTVTIRPDQGSDVAQRTQGRQAAAGAAPSGRPGAPPRDSDSPLSLTPDGVTARPAPPLRSAAVAAPPPPSPAAAPSASAGGWVVQVSAQNSEQEAQAAFRSMQAKYPGQLGGQQPLIRRKDLASGVKYGVQVGPYASREEAAKLCEELKSAGGSCFLAKN